MKLGQREDIDFIEVNKDFPLDLEEPQRIHNISSTNQGEIEWNVRWINADKVWAKGFTGTGKVVGVSDTGIQFNHPALIGSYRGNNNGQIDHNYNWFDGTPNRVAVPEDDNGHGTHCTGTAAGGVARRIGVAPGSKWIHCRSMKIQTRQWSQETFIACLQFFLAPTNVQGQNPDPTRRPHSTSHSYGCNAGLGCPNQEAMRPGSEALRAAGVYMMVSAGNSGPRCSTIDRQPCHYAAVITVAALNQNSDALAAFSSRGPITIDNSNRQKPNIAAPGVNVMSAFPGDRYTAMSGTSMASPAVNGAVALIWNAVPSLDRNLDRTAEVIYASAKRQPSNECGSNGVPNNLFGYGTIDVDKAVTLAMEIYGN